MDQMISSWIKSFLVGNCTSFVAWNCSNDISSWIKSFLVVEEEEEEEELQGIHCGQLRVDILAS
jgi:hypothetical protein